MPDGQVSRYQYQLPTEAAFAYRSPLSFAVEWRWLLI